MEDIKPTTPSPSDSRTSSGDVDVIEARFKDFCKNGLALDDNTQMQATKILRGTKQQLVSNMSSIGSGSAEEAERFWFAFVLYSVKRLSESTTYSSELKSNANGYTLCQVLRTVKLNIVDFFKELPQFVVRAAPVLSNMYGKDWEGRLEAKELQATFVHLSVLSKHYKRTYWEYFLSSDSDVNGHSGDANLTCYMSDCYRFGWLLFLAVRVHALSSFKDLLTCTNGLVSILAILIIHIPARFRKFNIHDSSLFVKKDDKGVDLIASLCKIYSVPEEELRRTLIKANKLVEDILKKSPRAASDCKFETLENIDTDGLVYFEDLFEPSSLSSCINLLEKDYDDALHKKGELDERLFLNEGDSLLASSSLSGGSINNIGAKRKFDSISSPTRTITSPLSPHRSPVTHANGASVSNSKVAATPLSTAMTTAKWLRTVISPLPSKPSAELQKFFALCDRDVTSDVVRRAHIIMEAIFPSSALGERCVSGNLQGANLMDKIWAEQRRIEAIKLYYRVLEAMCRAESQVLNGHNLTSLLINERFHRCMLACSAELVLATHKTVTMLFPAVLERTGITAYDLSKVIEGFIRHEESLPRELRRHLNSLEEKLLESMVWEKSSSMYNTLAVAKPALAGEINRLGLLAEPMPSLDAVAMRINFSCGGLPPSFPSSLKQETLQGQAGNLMSPKRVRSEYRSALIERNSITSPGKDRLLALGNLRSKLQPPLQSAFASPTKPCPGSGGETYAETGVRIFFSKIIKLAAVRVSVMVERLQLSQQIRESVYCLFQKILNQRTSLFFNRHIDQLILCCFYGVAKISQLKLTFREIINNYRKQPQSKPQVFRSVFVDWSLSCRSGKAGHDHVDIITFYNEFFIPAVKPLLVEFSPQGMSSKSTLGSEAKASNDAPGLGSPDVSPFPNLPDMSPKKVSAQHNVYVSPLRSSKMDVLVSHSSKSYYACVGESTHAYQSPSKDLTAINNCLNRGSTRKLRGTLNFDDADVGLPVSDSVVANSLYPQNGSSPRSSRPEH